MRKAIVAALLMLTFALLLGGCGGSTTASPTASPSPSEQTAASLASQYGLHLSEGLPMTLPQTFGGLPWDHYQSACLESGFDLRPYRGREVLFTAHPLRERHGHAPATLWVISADDHVIGAYVAVDGEIPGIYSLEQAGAGF